MRWTFLAAKRKRKLSLRALVLLLFLLPSSPNSSYNSNTLHTQLLSPLRNLPADPGSTYKARVVSGDSILMHGDWVYPVGRYGVH